MLFGGAQYRVEIGAAIADRGFVANTAELAAELGINRQSVHQELTLLERVGLLVRAPRAGDSERKVYFTAQPSSHWGTCLEARADAARMLERMPRY
jgi:DNA-binding IclR family transcriptional regulator